VCAGEWQPVELRLRDATIELSERGDGWILDGRARVDAHHFDNMLPLPFRRGGAVTLVLRGEKLGCDPREPDHAS
jgi:hypothetical protein